jgi:Ser/Thr protein kinase RdoA (MazF antagonist)
VEYADPPGWLLNDAGLAVMPEEIHPREGRAWLVRWQGTRGILRQLPAAVPSAPAGQLTADLAWLHAFLARLAGLGFPSPRPLPCFGGRSWTMTGRTLWEAVSFLPGHAISWAGQPPMEDIGALLARYHAAARRIGVTSQRPAALPLADVPGILLSRQFDATRISPDQAALIRRQAGLLARDLDATGHRARERAVVHGDFTNDNVLADGTPPRPAGVIDFAGAHLETPLADIGYGLWRSGRPYPAAGHLDLSRAARFLRGYARIAPVPADDARVIAVYMRGRGLQMIAKRVRAGRAETGMLAQLQWLTVNEADIRDTLAAAVG